MSLPNRLQNINNSYRNTNLQEKNDRIEFPGSLETTEEEGQIYLDITKHVTKSIAKYKFSQFKKAFKNALYNNSQYNDEGL